MKINALKLFAIINLQKHFEVRNDEVLGAGLTSFCRNIVYGLIPELIQCKLLIDLRFSTSASAQDM
jgi:hypothetical protein